MLVNALHGHLCEFGVIGAKGISQLPDLLALASSTPVCQLPDLARECIELLLAQIEDLQRRIALVERSITRWHKTDPLPEPLLTPVAQCLRHEPAADCARYDGLRSGHGAD